MIFNEPLCRTANGSGHEEVRGFIGSKFMIFLNVNVNQVQSIENGKVTIDTWRGIYAYEYESFKALYTSPLCEAFSHAAITRQSLFR